MVRWHVQIQIYPPGFRSSEDWDTNFQMMCSDSDIPPSLRSTEHWAANIQMMCWDSDIPPSLWSSEHWDAIFRWHVQIQILTPHGFRSSEHWAANIHMMCTDSDLPLCADNFTLVLTSNGQKWQFHTTTDIYWSWVATAHCYWPGQE